MRRLRGPTGTWHACLSLAAFLVACRGSSVASSPDADVGSPDATAESSADGGSEDDEASSGDDGPSIFTQCVPGDISGFHPQWHPPATPQSACTESELDDLISDCFETVSTTGSCDAFQQTNPGCWSCMVTPDSNQTWGPIVVSSVTHLYYANYAGCLALETGDDSATSCGAKQQAARVCSEFACSGSDCPAYSPAQLAAISTCTGEALDAGCSSYQAAAVACAEGLLAEGGTSEAAEKYCNGGNYGDLPTYYRALGPLFCGVIADAGVDGD